MSLYLGQFAALLAAFFWALATLMYSRSSHHLSSVQLNLVKGLVACPLLFLATLLLPTIDWAGTTTNTLVILTLSGIIGITLGDSCYFAALRRLGPGHTILLEYLAPPLAAAIAWLVLSERLSLLQVIAAFVVIAGVVAVLTEKQLDTTYRPNRSGYLFGIAAALCQAVGLVMAFSAFQAATIAPIEAALVRLMGGTAALTIGLLILRPRLLLATREALRKTQIAPLFLAIVLGTFLAIWLQQVAVAYVTPGVAQTLLSTAPLFMLGLNVFRGRRVSFRALSGTLVAMAGITLLFII
ncbi:MAG: DMT family transporter [Idiomarina sp.]|nr:DMT family transporter [Idiomarina sp.]